MTLVFNYINCLSYMYNVVIMIKGSHQVMTDCPLFITSPEPSCRPIRKYFAKKGEYDKGEELCFTFNKAYDSIFFLSTSLVSTPECTPNHTKKIINVIIS